MIRVLLIDDHVAYRQAFAVVLEREADFQIIGQATDEASARNWLAEADIAIVGLPLSNEVSIRLIRELHAVNPHGKAVVFVPNPDRREVALALEAGAFTTLPASMQLSEVADALRGICAGEPLLPPQEIIELLRQAAEYRESTFSAMQTLNRLTPREIEILQILAEGMGDREIAERLMVSTQTVRTHFVNILSKLNVNSRIQALIFAVEHGVAEIRRK